MKTHITLINPNLVTQIEDSLGSGIPYMPITLAYMNAILKEDYKIDVIDMFGEDPFKVSKKDNFWIQGLTLDDLKNRINMETEIVLIFVNTIMAYNVVIDLVRFLKKVMNNKKVILLENTQAVIGCSLDYIAEEFIESGVDYIILGEPENKAPFILDLITNNDMIKISKMNGIISRDNVNFNENQNVEVIKNLDKLPFPDWSSFPLNNYWKLGYSHGPMENNYISILTSRGCPFKCNFCVVPATNESKWRPRSAENVVEELKHYIAQYNVREFHLEDLNPTANENRIKDICKLITKKKLDITWKLASGSKIETMKLKTLELMKKAGCNYISFSPESGSEKVLDLMEKPFDHDYALKMTKHMDKLKIYSQACFVLGYPGESKKDLKLTKKYIYKLTKAGIDEIALFIMTPIPGTETFGQLSGYDSYSELTFSPAWREDFKFLSKYRLKLYLYFLIIKLLFHPIKTFKQFINLCLHSFKTKVEMNIYRMIKFKKLIRKGIK